MHAFNSGPWEVEAVASLRSSLAWSIELRDTQVYIEKLWKRLHVDWRFHVDRLIEQSGGLRAGVNF